MKKINLILTAVTVLALAAMSCSLQFAPPDPPPPPPPPSPQGPGFPPPPPPSPEGQFPPPPPTPEGPSPEVGNPGGNPGQGNIGSFGADRTTLNKGECAMLHWETEGGFGVTLDGQPVERAGQRQVCPQQTTVYRLGVDNGDQVLTREVTITVNSGGQNPNPVVPTKPPTKKPDGGNKTVTDTPSSPIFNITAIAVVANLDLALVNIFVRPGDGHVMATFRNAGNVNLNTTTTLKCANGSGNGALVSTKTVTLNLKPGEIFNQDTGWTKQTAATLACSFTPPSGDTHHNNDSMTTTIK